MKYFLNILMITAIIGLASCNDDDNTPGAEPELVNQWSLIEQLVDPGDGSGTFQPVESNKVIEFFSDGTVRSNSTLCFMDPDGTNQTFTGTYDPDEMTINPDDCSDDDFLRLTYEQDGGILYLYYLCIEPCGQKFVVVER